MKLFENNVKLLFIFSFLEKFTVIEVFRDYLQTGGCGRGTKRDWRLLYGALDKPPVDTASM